MVASWAAARWMRGSSDGSSSAGAAPHSTNVVLPIGADHQPREEKFPLIDQRYVKGCAQQCYWRCVVQL